MCSSLSSYKQTAATELPSCIQEESCIIYTWQEMKWRKWFPLLAPALHISLLFREHTHWIVMENLLATFGAHFCCVRLAYRRFLKEINSFAWIAFCFQFVFQLKTFFKSIETSFVRTMLCEVWLKLLLQKYNIEICVHRTRAVSIFGNFVTNQFHRAVSNS